jgi:hypothetical protein
VELQRRFYLWGVRFYHHWEFGVMLLVDREQLGAGVAAHTEEFTLRLVDFAEGSVEGYFGEWHVLTNQFPTADLAEFAVLNHVWRSEAKFNHGKPGLELLLRQQQVAILDGQRRMVRLIVFRDPQLCESRLPVAMVLDCATGKVETTARAEEFAC